MYTSVNFSRVLLDESMQTVFAKNMVPRRLPASKNTISLCEKNYDSMIDNLNKIRRMYGKDEVPLPG